MTTFTEPTVPDTLVRVVRGSLVAEELAALTAVLFSGVSGDTVSFANSDSLPSWCRAGGRHRPDAAWTSRSPAGWRPLQQFFL
ncbi:acyl-CoA carboxylase epsilon subunit-like protein [Streptomyces sp. 846.5]|nr:acyl-CoA carboxylase subunit epsilon [Streptomyces sp. 846.5]TDU02168.1 acyl-CoA carboxylase epsilon subunit-like protein [Streptomyces sp. 846.5]